MITLDLPELKKLIDNPDNLILDIRSAHDYADGFISGSYFLPNKTLLPELLSIYDFTTFNKLIIISDEQANPFLVDAIQAAVGEKVAGVFYTEKDAYWLNEMERDMVITIEPDELAMDLPFDDKLVLIDVRQAHEFANGHIAGARHFSLDDLGDPANIALIPEEGNIYLYCSNSDRSMLVASVFKKHGLHNLRVITALWDSISTTPGLSFEKEASQLN